MSEREPASIEEITEAATDFQATCLWVRLEANPDVSLELSEEMVDLIEYHRDSCEPCQRFEAGRQGRN